jgi:hypothetical protein
MIGLARSLWGFVATPLGGVLIAGALAASIYGKGWTDGRAALKASIVEVQGKAQAGAKQEADRVIGGDRSRVKGFDRD